ncbi:MAG: DoxX family membrane protein [Deltaproteobacteria bacterium]|nr:DoxX family membrane protein [Deltaproteobacteria bacterium]
MGELVSLACRLAVAGLFLTASYDKVWEPGAFAASLAEYELAPLALVHGASAWLAWLEFLTGILLVLGIWTRAAAGWTTALLAFFTGLMIWAGLTGAGYDCGCFPGHGEGHTAGYSAALRDLAFLIPSAWLMFRPGRWLALAPGEVREREPGLLLHNTNF